MSVEEREIRNVYAQALSDLDVATKDFEDWNETNGPELANNIEVKAGLKEMKGLRDDDNKFVLSLNERREFDELIGECN